MSQLISEPELAFLLYEVLETERLLDRPRYADCSRHAFDATIEAARRVATDQFAPHNRDGDENEPQFENGAAKVLPQTGAAWRSFAEAGFLSAHWDAEDGGLALPEVVLRAALSQFFAANASTTGYPFLTIGVGNLVRTFGTDEQKQCFLPGLGDGSSAGTMGLTEPGQGSALGDIKTYAVLQPDGTYRIFGQKMFISGGDQDFTDNIVHMVLARIQGEAAGAKGISLFLVPKWLVNEDGSKGERNDLALAGLLHKMGWHNTTSTVLSFGENGGAVGYLVGEKNRGLAHMFQMMNEARIGVGLIAASLAYRGFAESLAYAKERRQGRLPSQKNPLSEQVRLIEHADVRRLLIAQKSFSEGALALCLYASSLFEDQHTHPDSAEREQAGLLLDVLTPIVKSWSAKYGCASNEMAMQVLGGAGYTREYPLEQLYRDQRLNPIHEGSEAIHGLDLLGRKVAAQGGAGLQSFYRAVSIEIDHAEAHPQLREFAVALGKHLAQLKRVTIMLVDAQASNLDLALANATVYLDVFGCVTVGWMWLWQARIASAALASACASAGYPVTLVETSAERAASAVDAIRAECERMGKSGRLGIDRAQSIPNLMTASHSLAGSGFGRYGHRSDFRRPRAEDVDGSRHIRTALQANADLCAL
jgi:alkylation response protein AidB-like acyl-CoA dehydrogenase